MSENIDFDGAWKEVLEIYLRPFLEFCFPVVAAGIDWTVPVEFLDKELQEIVRDAELGKQRVDKLVKVRRLDGDEEWLLIHVEIQGQPDNYLSLRVYQYHHRIEDRFGRRVISLVVLSDEHENWRPDCYEQSLWGCRVRFEFPICKLMDFAKDRARLEASDNPAAIVIAAHLAAQETRGNMELRKKSKWQMTRRLYERGYSRKDVLELFRLIDWLMVLPEGLEIAFSEELFKFESEKTMPYVTSIERLGLQKGRQEGRQEGRREGRQEEAANIVARLAQKRFPMLSVKIENDIRRLPVERLEVLGEALLDLGTFDELETWLQNKAIS